jgi:hypothetical protein
VGGEQAADGQGHGNRPSPSVSRSADGAVDEGWVDQGREPVEGDAEDVADDDIVRIDEEDCQVGVDAADASQPGQRVGARAHKLGGAVPGQQAHHHEGLSGAGGQVYRAADGGDVEQGGGIA